MSGAGENGTKRGGGRLLLLGSLALNVFLIGAIVSHVAFRPPRGDGRDHRGFVERVLENESSEQLKALAQELRQARGAAWRGQREESKQAFEGMMAALRASNFDREAYLEASAARDEARNGARRAANEALADFAAQLTVEQRSRMADMMEQRQREPADLREPAGPLRGGLRQPPRGVRPQLAGLPRAQRAL